MPRRAPSSASASSAMCWLLRACSTLSPSARPSHPARPAAPSRQDRSVIYTVEIDFTSQAHFSEWAAWYNGNLPLMMSVPGFDTAQRLEIVAGNAPRFLAIYTISDANVFESAAYLA